MIIKVILMEEHFISLPQIYLKTFTFTITTCKAKGFNLWLRF